MNAATTARGNARLWIATLALMLAAAPVSAQCVISGPSALCNGSAQLCGPAGSYMYTWSGPNGFLETTPCVTVTVPGTYMLSLIDTQAQRFVGMCSTTLAAGTAVPVPTIDGPLSACDGEAVTLCGPDLGYGFQWTGPTGTANTRCVTGSGPGTWTLTLVDLATGCTSATATWSIQPELCSSFSACPRPPSFWMRGCRRPDKFRYTPEQVSSFASCVDARSALVAWESPLEGLCRTLNPPEATLRGRALRQLVGLWMNVCAFDSHQLPATGTPVGLDGSATFTTANGTSTTVLAWLGGAETRMLELAGLSQEKKAVREAYRALIQQAWKLNHGEGTSAPCGTNAPSPELARLSPAGDDADVEEPLEAQMMWELERVGAIVLDRPAPNPMVKRVTVAFTIEGATPRDVGVAVYDISGRRVAQLISGTLSPGRHSATWDGQDDSGGPVRPGVYFVRARAGNSETRTTLTVVR